MPPLGLELFFPLPGIVVQHTLIGAAGSIMKLYGTNLVGSAAIFDETDRMVSPERRLMQMMTRYDGAWRRSRQLRLHAPKGPKEPYVKVV